MDANERLVNHLLDEIEGLKRIPVMTRPELREGEDVEHWYMECLRLRGVIDRASGTLDAIQAKSFGLERQCDLVVSNYNSGMKSLFKIDPSYAPGAICDRAAWALDEVRRLRDAVECSRNDFNRVCRSLQEAAGVPPEDKPDVAWARNTIAAMEKER